MILLSHIFLKKMEHKKHIFLTKDLGSDIAEIISRFYLDIANQILYEM